MRDYNEATTAGSPTTAQSRYATRASKQEE